MELARSNFPEEFALMTGPAAPVILPPRRDPASPDQLKQLLFGEILRLQGILDISRGGKLTSISFPLPSFSCHYT
jgi:hypothetical protein